MNAKTRSRLATVVAALAFVWHSREIATVTARTPARPFPFVPAAITLVACLLALRWWNDAKDPWASTNPGSPRPERRQVVTPRGF